MAAGKRPVPFRTRKLSPPAPMVLLPGGSGRVGYRRPNNFTQHTRCKHHAYSGCFAIRAPSIPRGVWVDPRIADNHDGTHHWRTPTNDVAGLLVKVHAGDFPPGQTATESGPFVNGYETSPAKIRIADNHSGTHHGRTPMKTPGRNHPAGRDRSTRGHIGRGDSTRSHDDADSGAKVEYRTSSTPAYTDELDLHYSTNNAPTKTWGRARLRIADNPRCTHDWCAPTNSVPGPHSALRTTTAAPIIGAHPRKPPPRTPHCGQLRLHQQWVPAHEPRSWRSRKG